jgi:hypothetical protein
MTSPHSLSRPSLKQTKTKTKIKSDVLLARDWTAKIADVGLSKVLRDRYVSTMHAVGTYAWAAPEVLLGQPTSEAADIYSFGVILHELCVAGTGEGPPTGRHLRPVAVPDEAPAAVVEVMGRCLSSDPAARPTALELVHFFVDLGRAGSGSGATAAEVVVVSGDGDGGPTEPTARAGSGRWLARRLSRRGSKEGDGGGSGEGGGGSRPPPAVPPPSWFGGGGGGGGAPPPAVPPPSGLSSALAGGGGGGGAVPPPSGFGAASPPGPPPAPAVRRATGGPPPKAPEV